MTRNEAREYIRSKAREHFRPDKKDKGYICPICGSGEGRNGTGITTRDNEHFTCWRGCFTNADIFDIIGLEYGLSDYNEKFKKACDIFGITVERDTFSPYRPETKTTHAQKHATGNEDYTEFYKTACARIDETEYHRGISVATLKAYSVGYVGEWRHPKSPNAPATPRLIIPNSQRGYLARDTRGNLTDKEKPYEKQRVGHAGIWNLSAMYEASQPVYVVEGEFDALSVIDAGGMAVALCSVSNAGKFLEEVKSKRPVQGIIISTDNDQAGIETGAKLSEYLTQAEIFSYRHELPKGYKDANAFLMTDREGFTAWVHEGITACKEEMKGIADKEREQFERESVSGTLKDFLRVLKTSREGQAISTGFLKLDEILGGGLYPGLYVIGAISSLGKTSFCLQLADQIAKAGHGVLIFSLEMSRNELIAKSLSRLTRLLGSDKEYAKTTRGILRADFNPIELELFTEAVNEYNGYAGNLFITEGIGDVGVADIRRKIERFMSFNDGKPPVVIIDYVQILAPADSRATDKQNTDKNILELKRISRDCGMPVIGISSFNRENYYEPVSMAAFKESGAIEYSSDVLIGLQYSGWERGEKEKDSEYRQRIRARLKEIFSDSAEGTPVGVDLKILKHRNGKKGTVRFQFYSMFNLFKETSI